MPATTCARDGCHRPARPKREFCSTGCAVSDAELRTAERVLDIAGGGAIAVAYRDSAIAFADAWGVLQHSRREVYRAAIAAGLSAAEGKALLAKPAKVAI